MSCWYLHAGGEARPPPWFETGLRKIHGDLDVSHEDDI